MDYKYKTYTSLYTQFYEKFNEITIIRWKEKIFKIITRKIVIFINRSVYEDDKFELLFQKVSNGWQIFFFT